MAEQKRTILGTARGATTGVARKVAGLAQDVMELEKKKLVIRELAKAGTTLDKWNKDLPLLEKTSKKTAENLKALLAGYFKLDATGKLIRGDIEDFNKKVELQEKKLEKWYENIVEKGKEFIQENIAEIGAGVLAANAWHKAVENTRSATDHLVQTTGRLNASWTETLSMTQKLGTAISNARVAAAGYGVDVESIEQATRRYYDLFQTNEGIPGTFKGLAAMSRVWGVQFEDLFQVVEHRQRNFGRTAKQTVEELSGVLHASEKLNENLKRLNITGGLTAEIWRSDFFKVVKESSEELGELNTDMAGLAKIQGKAAEYARKLGLSTKDTLEFAKNTAKALKLPDILQMEFGEQLVAEYKKAKAEGRGQEYLISQAGEKADTAKQILDQMTDPEDPLISVDAFKALYELSMTSTAGLERAMTVQGKWLAQMDPGVAASQLGIDDPVQANLVASYLRKGGHDVKALAEMLGRSEQELVSDFQKRKETDDKAKAGFEASLDDAKSGAEVMLQKATDTVKGLLADPLISLGASLGVLLTKFVANRITYARIIGATEATRAEVGMLNQSIRALFNKGPGGGVGGAGAGGAQLDLFNKGTSAAGGAVEGAPKGRLASMWQAGKKALGLGGTAATGAGAVAAGGVNAAAGAANKVGKLAKIGKFAKKIPWIGPILTALTAYSSFKEEGTKGLVKTATGTLAGTGAAIAAGAAMGSIFPGVGTIIGGVVGLGASLIASHFAEKAADYAYDKLAKKDGATPPEPKTPGMTPNVPAAVQKMEADSEEAIRQKFGIAKRRGQGNQLEGDIKYVEDGSGDMIVEMNNASGLALHKRRQA